MDPTILIAGALLLLVLIGGVGWVISRFRTCPADKVLVVYGKTAGDKASKCIHGGAEFVWPVIQDYQYLDLTPIGISVDLKNALSKQNIRVDVPSKFTVGVSTDPGVMENAAERLLGQSQQAIQDMAKDIIFGQLRLVIAQMDIEEINANRDKLLSQVSTNVGQELKKIGLKLINVNITDIVDESGYIAALGQEATAKAINEAKISVAEHNKNGAIGEAKAKKEQRIQVAQTESETLVGEAEARQKQRIQVANAEATALAGEAEAKKAQRIKVAQADSQAIIGENEADAKIAESNATLRERKAEAARRANTAEKIKIAQVNQ
jgi:flotillin